jgi:hypothetical protein
LLGRWLRLLGIRRRRLWARRGSGRETLRLFKLLSPEVGLGLEELLRLGVWVRIVHTRPGHLLLGLLRLLLRRLCHCLPLLLLLLPLRLLLRALILGSLLLLPSEGRQTRFLPLCIPASVVLCVLHQVLRGGLGPL